MLSSVKEVEYYYTVVANKPGEARRLLDFLSEKVVNLRISGHCYGPLHARGREINGARKVPFPVVLRFPCVY